MTVSPDVPPLAAGSLDEAIEALRARGLRLSTSRRLVLEVLFAADGPVSAERVARRLKLDPASVHRNFETLERHGLVRHVHLGHGPGLYALLGRGEREYLFCDRCGAVRALPRKELDPVRKRIKERYGYETRFNHFAIVGTCAACSAQAPREGTPQSSTKGARGMTGESHEHEHGHSHRHQHDDGVAHEHAHTGHEHDHVEHEHEHSHGDHVHSHAHVHQEGLEDQHEHGH